MKINTLRDYRVVHGYSMEKMGELLKIHAQTYSKIEKDPNIATIAQAKEIAKIFNVSVDDIFFEKNV
ncbi:MAG: helix-turn-helix transcriptional regulator [Erysipelotrichaceae bacterium]